MAAIEALRDINDDWYIILTDDVVGPHHVINEIPIAANAVLNVLVLILRRHKGQQVRAQRRDLLGQPDKGVGGRRLAGLCRSVLAGSSVASALLGMVTV